MEGNYVMIKIYQIQLTEDQVNLINETGDHNSVPAQKAKLDASILGKFSGENFKFYTEAYHVYSDDLEEAFEATNLWNKQEIVDVIGDRGYSSSTGDIFEKNGEFFLCANFGFNQVEVA